MNDQHGYWRSLAELRQAAAGEASEPSPEFDAPASPPTSGERRRFLQLMGASTALASAGVGCRWKEDKILPLNERPEGVTPGVPRTFHTAMELSGTGFGLRVKSFDGRPIKVDGNVRHPDSLGASTAFHQASVLELYDPDRSSGYARLEGGQLVAATEIDFRVFARGHFREVRKSRGKGFHIISGATSSLTVAEARAELLERFPEAKWHVYEPVETDNARLGAVAAFGSPFRTHLDVSAANVIVALDADILGSGPAALAAARGWSQRRDPAGPMNRLYAIEASLSETGMAADHRMSLRKEHIKAVVGHLDAAIDRELGPGAEFGPPQPEPTAAILADADVSKLLGAIVKDLVAQRGKGLVVVGPDQPPELHAVVHRINARLGNVGTAVTYSAGLAEEATAPTSAQAIRDLTQAMSAGQVDTLLVLDSNPAYTAPGDLDFAGALTKVKAKISLSLFRDETARLCDWHAPLAHFLESWGDVRGSDGTLTIQQPLIAPLYAGRTIPQFLAMLSRRPDTKGPALVQRALRDQARDPRLWRRAVHDGVVPSTSHPRQAPSLRAIAPLQLSSAESSGLEVDTADLEVCLEPDSRLYDGRFANSGWLQEMPDRVTKLTWDNALLVGPKTAQALGVTDGLVVTVTVKGASKAVDAPVLVTPGQAPGSIKLNLGYGRTAAGHVAGDTSSRERVAPVGVSAYPLRSSSLWSFARGGSVKSTGRKHALATTQDKHKMDRIGRDGTAERMPQLVREATLHEFEKHPDFAQHVVHHPPLLSLWQEPVKYEGHKWGMSIDLNKCIGCSGCVVACQAENNIPVVGKEQVSVGREMHWLRIDRYFQGDPEQPEAANQPVPCMHCEHAPCEQVCPVGATMHSREGLNDMAYNRCVGTRYCSNNCPYKVRRFNYFNFHEDLKREDHTVKSMVFNPDVTVRSRGVMEKCSYCVQRIQNGKLQAAREGRPLADQEVTTACQDSCPTQAITFGDLNDAASKVAQASRNPRDYSLLEELNVRPRTRYLARVRNPHPELG